MMTEKTTYGTKIRFCPKVKLGGQCIIDLALKWASDCEPEECLANMAEVLELASKRIREKRSMPKNIATLESSFVSGFGDAREKLGKPRDEPVATAFYIEMLHKTHELRGCGASFYDKGYQRGLKDLNLE